MSCFTKPSKGENTMSDRDEFGAFLVGFVVGGLTGAVVALLFAPQSGEETRALIKDKSIELRDRAAHSAEEALARAEAAAAEARQRADELAKIAKERANELANEVRERGKGAIEAVRKTKKDGGEAASA
ncbi:MAG: YtxH domain-containing protein [Anaerolineaceae bacterium]|jgi:gas vesicle protein|nr:MAG: YtxH domain-containing protein [Anaerolineaceae bacterium]